MHHPSYFKARGLLNLILSQESSAVLKAGHLQNDLFITNTTGLYCGWVLSPALKASLSSDDISGQQRQGQPKVGCPESGL